MLHSLETVTRVESHGAQVLRDSHQTLDFITLLISHGLIGLKDFTLLDKVFPHLHDLVHILIFELDNFLKGFLIHINHLEIFVVVSLVPLII